MALKKGSFLIELLIAVAIIFFVAGLWVPLLKNDPLTLLTDERELFTYTIEMLRQQALSTGEKQILTIYSDAQAFGYQTVSGECIHYLSNDLCFGLPPGAAQIPFFDKPAAVTWCTFPSAPPNFNVTIFPNGKVSTGFVSISHKNLPLAAALTYDASGLSYRRRYLYKSNGWHLDD